MGEKRYIGKKHSNSAYFVLLVSITIALSLCTIYTIHYNSSPISVIISANENEEYHVHPVYHYERDSNGNRRLMAHMVPDEEPNRNAPDLSFGAKLQKRLMNALHAANERKKDERPPISYDAFR